MLRVERKGVSIRDRGPCSFAQTYLGLSGKILLDWKNSYIYIYISIVGSNIRLENTYGQEFQVIN